MILRRDEQTLHGPELRLDRRRHFTAGERAEMVRLYRDELWSLPEIGRHFGCDPATVRLWLIHAGVPRRTHVEQAEAARERVRRNLERGA